MDSVNYKMKLRFSGITRRWFLNTFCVILILLTVLTVSVSYALKQYYYKIAENTIDSSVSVISTENFFSGYTGTTDGLFESGARLYVENFAYSDLMEVWVIDKNSKPVVSSTGFSVKEDNMPDFDKASKNQNGEGVWIGRYSTGEKILAKTFILKSADSEIAGAVRYIVSLEDLNNQHFKYTLLIVAVGLLSLLFVTVSGLYFIRSIVLPVNKINETAKKIALGDFNVKIEGYNHDDEIGELCDTFNNMSGEIAKSDKMKNDFISTVSHELRTPLTAIKGWGETLNEMGTQDTELTDKALKVIVKEADRLNVMVEELLDFSRIQSGRLTLRMEKTDVIAELDEAVFVFNDRAIREGIEFTYNSPDIISPMTADASRIKQVFVNLLDNAFKYSNKDGKVSVFAYNSADFVIIEISDNGCGINEEDLVHVKEKFFKANLSVRGSGIGLAVVDEIIKLHNGFIDISSEADKGTKVTVKLPLDIN